MKRFVIALIILLLLSGVVDAQLSLNTESQKQMVMTNLSSMPLAFTENRGQWNEKALFKAEAGGATFWFCKDEVAYVFTRNTDELIDDGISHGPDIPGMPDKFNHPRYKKESMVLYAQFVGANAKPEVNAEKRLGYNCNYFLGNIPSKWATDVPNWSSLTYKGIYPGIDLKYHGDGKGMKYDFIVNPGANISQIKIKYDGVINLSISNEGELEASTSFGPIHENIPDIYQEIDGNKHQISGRYKMLEPGVFGFEVDNINPAYPAVIDPALIYSTYLGGLGDDYGEAIAVDANGSAYITGNTDGDFPIQNPYQGTNHGIFNAFVTKFSPAGNSLVYSTYIGGSGTDRGNAIALDNDGHAYIAGETNSTDFPTLVSFQGTFGGGLSDAFVTLLSAAGNSIIFSTYLGGSWDDYAYGIAVDHNRNAYVCGKTVSTNFPTQNPYQGTLHNSFDAFVTKFSIGGYSLIYSTYLGGNDVDVAKGIAVDYDGHAYIAGWTQSPDFPVFVSYQGTYGGGYGDAFVTMLSVEGNSLIYSTYLGGSSQDIAYGIAVDHNRYVYACGKTYSSNFPTQNPYQGTKHGDFDAFVTKFALGGYSLIYSTYLGGNITDEANGIAVNLNGDAYITGMTNSPDFPTYDPYQGTYGGRGIYLGYGDAFVTRISPTGNPLVYSTFLGGNDDDLATGITVDTSGNAYIAGFTYSDNFPVHNPFQGTMGSVLDVFVTKLGPSLPCDYIIGDANGSGNFNGLDVSYGVTYFKGGPPPPYSCECPPHGTWYVAGDVNGTCSYNGLDVTYAVSYFKGGPPPHPCADCPPVELLAPPAPGKEPASAVQQIVAPTLNIKPKAGRAE